MSQHTAADGVRSLDFVSAINSLEKELARINRRIAATENTIELKRDSITNFQKDFKAEVANGNINLVGRIRELLVDLFMDIHNLEDEKDVLLKGKRAVERSIEVLQSKRDDVDTV